jgi:hypothetical protein
MAFTLPTFNLTAAIRTNAATTGAPRLLTPCNLAYSRRIANQLVSAVVSIPPGGFNPAIYLLLPAGTDVRDGLNSSGADGVEVPAGSGRFYVVTAVDDAGKGFPNEHRVAVLSKTGNVLGFWPTPIP